MIIIFSEHLQSKASNGIKCMGSSIQKGRPRFAQGNHFSAGTMFICMNNYITDYYFFDVAIVCSW